MKTLSILMFFIALVVGNLFWISHRIESGNAGNISLEHVALLARNQHTKRSAHSLFQPQELEEKAQSDRQILQELLNMDRKDPYNRSNPRGIEEYYQAQSQTVETVLTNITQKFVPHFNESYPDITIVGFQKAGTSQLFQILKSHSRTIAPKGKEYCVDGTHRLDYTYGEDRQDWHRKLFQWHQTFHNVRSTSSKKTLNACLQHDELEYKIRFNPPQQDARFLFLFRDPADWMWAAFNYWYDYHLDTNSPDQHDWLDPKLHYRSPELFHELVASQDKLKHASRYFETFRKLSVRLTRKIQRLVGRDRVICLKNEDMLPGKIVSSGFLTTIANETGLDMEEFLRSSIHKSKTNCNAQKGITSKSNTNDCDSMSTPSQSRGAGYLITENRPMLYKTRIMLYLQWQEECQIWAEEFGIVYPECLNAKEAVKPLMT
jgi:hypothetical protein